MRRLLLLSLLSVGLYLAAFGLVLDRPLSLGLLRLELQQKTERLAALPSPKLVILAGSNGPYSHSCAVIGPMLGLPCENAGIAVGIGLDDIFARYQNLLHPGDVLYMPMELQQYSASRGQYWASVDGAFLLRHDWQVLAGLPPLRVLGAFFCCSLADGLEALAEMPVARAHVIKPAALLASEYNVEGDRIDNDWAAADPALLQAPPRMAPTPDEIAGGYGTVLIGRFVAREAAGRVSVIGGLPVDFTNAVIPPGTVAAVSGIYTGHGGVFMELPGQSRYPVRDFFNGEDHLAKPCQYLHSVAVAYGLGAVLHLLVHPPERDVADAAAACPLAAAASLEQADAIASMR
jgi:hypothetical protein